MFKPLFNPPVIKCLLNKINRTLLYLALTLTIFSNLSCTSATTELFRDILRALVGDPVTVPASDSTPPEVKIIVPRLGAGGSDVTITNTPRTFRITNELMESGIRVFAVTEDPEGAKSIDIPFHDATINCSRGDIGQLRNFLLDGPGATSSAGVGETATTRIWVSYYIFFGGYRCTKDFNLNSLSITFNAKGKNFQNTEVTTASVTFAYP
jgi:hypothetical protein